MLPSLWTVLPATFLSVNPARRRGFRFPEHLFAFFAQYLDARIKSVIVYVVIHGLFAKKVNRRSVRSCRIRGHLQLVGSGLLPIGKCKRGQRSQSEANDESTAKGSGQAHLSGHRIPCRKADDHGRVALTLLRCFQKVEQELSLLQGAPVRDRERKCNRDYCGTEDSRAVITLKSESS